MSKDVHSTDEERRQEAQGPKDKALHTGVIDTGGSGLHHTDQTFKPGPDTVTPRDVSEANPFADVDQAGASRDGGTGMNTTGKQYEYPDGELIEE